MNITVSGQFYTMFYAVLTVLLAICTQELFASLDNKRPTSMIRRSAIGTNPTLELRPISTNSNEESLIRFNSNNATTINKWVNLLQEFLHEYNVDNQNQVVCTFDYTARAGQACHVDLRSFGDCSPENKFGYHTSTPCVYLKLNRIHGWVPEYYNDTKNLPDDMPDDLVARIKSEYAKDPARANQIWISCKGEHPADKENLSHTSFLYYPNMGLPGFYYPFTNVEGYLSPLVAVKLSNFTSNVIISIECRAWAKNIKYKSGDRDRQGSVQFEILRDE